MTSIAVLEHEKIYREDAAPQDATHSLDEKAFDQLKAYDERYHEETDERIFNSGNGYLKAKHWVGVLQLPNLVVEILPKTQERGDDGEVTGVRQNFLAMLSFAGELPLRARDLADQEVREMPLVETLIRIFAEQLLDELRLGPEANYVDRQDNLNVLRGKLLFTEHVKRNPGRHDRFFVEYDEFVPDTPMNRIFKCACRRLIRLTSVPQTHQMLGHCLTHLERASDTAVVDSDFDKVFLDRTNRRFETVFKFCKLLLRDLAPTGSSGPEESFSLLFPMHELFESFITRFLSDHVLTEEGLRDYLLYPEATTRREHLLHKTDDPLYSHERPADTSGERLYSPQTQSADEYQLKPDNLIVHRSASDDNSRSEHDAEKLAESPAASLVIDTKWKRLDPTSNGRQGVTGSDLYQMFAYTHAYGARHNVLLYPDLDESPDEQDYDVVVDDPFGVRQINVRQVKLHHDLSTSEGIEKVAKQLRELTEEMLHLGDREEEHVPKVVAEAVGE